MISKAILKEQIKELPERFSIDDLVERLILIEKIEVGIDQSEKEEIFSNTEIESEMEKWFISTPLNDRPMVVERSRNHQ